MNVIRCKDCMLEGLTECPLAYIEKQQLCFINHSPMFFCGKGKAAEDYEPTKGDTVRNMTDRELAEFINGIERDAYMQGAQKYADEHFSEKNIEFYLKYFGTVEGEDI